MATIVSLPRVAATGAEKSPLVQGATDKYRQHNFTATAVPGVTDDSDAGYSVGSLWYNTNSGLLYQAFSVTPGAADWRSTRRRHMGYVIGNYYLGEGIGPIASSGSSVSANKLYLHPIYIPETISISDLAFRTATTGNAGNTQLAIYAGRAAGSRPSARIGVISGIANAAVSTSYSGALVDGATGLLRPGYYWAACVTDTATNFVSINSSNNSAVSAQIGSATLNNVLNPSGSIVGLEMNAGGSNPTIAYNADPKVTFPTDLTGLTLTDSSANRVPVVAFKVAGVAPA